MKLEMLLCYCLLQHILCQFSLCNYQNDRLVTSLTSELCQFVYSYDRTCSSLQFQSCRYYGSCLSQNDTACTHFQIVVSYKRQDCLQRCCPVFHDQSMRLYHQNNCDWNELNTISTNANSFGTNTVLTNANSSLASKNDSQASANNISKRNQSNTPQNGRNSSASSFFNDALANNDDSSAVSHPKVIVAITLGCIAVVAVSIILTIKCRKKANQETGQYPELHIKHSQISSSEVHKMVTVKEWRVIQNCDLVQSMSELAQICSICLQECANTSLCCGHRYHKVCIGEWLKIDQMCPLCKADSISNMQIRCTKCQGYSYVCPPSLLKFSCLTPDVCVQCAKVHQK